MRSTSRHSFQRAQPVARIRDHGHSDAAATAAAAAAAGLGHYACKCSQQQLYEHVDSSVQGAQDPLILDLLFLQMIMVNGGDTAVGNATRLVRPGGGLTPG